MSPRLPGTWATGSKRAAATALSPGCNAGAGSGYAAESKATAGKCPKANPVVPSGTADSGRRGRRRLASAE